jgi:outer membrane protein OmpA-like peptidoglycan-associated protein
MRHIMLAGAIVLSVLSAGCATKKYVAQTVAPVETHVASVESKNDAKNADQDKTIAGQGQQIQDLDRSLSQTKEKLTDTDAKAVAAGQAAQQANQAAQQAGQSAQTANQAAGRAQQSADGARTFADQGLTRLEHTIDAVNKFQMVKSSTVLFGISASKLSLDAKKELDEFAQQASGLQRFVIEVQGFTDKTGSPTLNEALSQARAEEVARYLANEHQIPLRSISMLGSGYAQPVADDKTSKGRALNRRVELRLFAPEAGSATIAQAQQ